MKYWFIADAHLACRALTDAEKTKNDLILWLENAASDPQTGAIYLLGDIFDFWYEFAHSVPPQYPEVLAALTRLSKKVPIHFIPGNHDQWTYGYLEKQCGLIVDRKLTEVTLDGKRLLLAHGHSLNCQRFGVRLINAIFESRICRLLFSHLIIPRLGLAFGFRWSAANHRKHNQCVEHDRAIDYYQPHSSDNPHDEQTAWARQYVDSHPDTHYIIMGHRHRGENLMIRNTQLLILDDFFAQRGYALLTDGILTAEYFNSSDIQ